MDSLLDILDIKGPVGIIASQEFELTILCNRLGIKDIQNLDPIKFNNLLFCISGIGMVNSAIAATMISERYSPGLLISTGIGGAYASSGLRIGDVAVASSEIYGDTGAGYGERFNDLRDMGFPLIKNPAVFNEIPVTAKYSDILIEIARESGVFVKKGPFVTVSSVSDSPERSKWLESRYNALCENMEGAGVAHVAYFYGIDFLEIRGISNIAGERNKDKWNITLATENCQKVLMRFLDYSRMNRDI